MSYFTATPRDVTDAVKDAIETTQGHYLADLATEVYEWAKTKGWEPEPDRTFGDEIALIHSECSEALEAYRDWGFTDHTEESSSKPEGVGAEFADIFIRLLHYSKVHNIDLQFEYERKMMFNRTRSFRHGGRAL